MRLPRLLAGGAVVAVLTGTAACGLQAVEPKLQLRDAAHEFASARTGFLRLSIPSSADDVRAFAAAADASSTGDEGIPDADLQTILSSSLDVGYDRGDDAKSDTDDASRLLVRIGDLEAGELRSVEQLAYARVDVDGLVQEFPDLKEGVETFRAGLTGGAGEPAAPASLREPATALLDGRWVSLDYRAWMEQMAQAAPGAGGAADPGISERTAAEARDLLGKALGKAVGSVTRRESDDRLGDHLVAKIDLRTAYTELRSGLPDLVSGALADQLEQSLPPADSVPDTDVAVSFWVRDGKLTRVELDAAQFLDKPAGHLVLRADVLPGEKVTAPDGAVAFDLEAIAAETGMSLDELATGPQPDAVTIANFVDQDIRGAAYADGAVPSVAYLPRVLPDFADMAPGLQITAVGPRIQVTVGADTACLTLSPDGPSDGAVVPGPC